MPFLPNLTEGGQARQMIEIFAGYNHNLRIAEGQWYDEKNLSSAHYPLFSQRGQRSVYKSGIANLQGILAKDALAYVDGTTLYYNSKPVDGIVLSIEEEDCPKQLVSMGAYLCVFPDNVYVNTKNLTDCGSMGCVHTVTTAQDVTYTPCKVDGTTYENITSSETAPGTPVNGQYWLDLSGEKHVLKQYNSTTSSWTEIPTVYTMIQAEKIGEKFKEYDGVTITGAKYTGKIPEEPLEEKKRIEALQAQIEALNTDCVLYGCATDYIIVAGMIDQQVVQKDGGLCIERKIPKMNFVCESNNRLWGCYYGAADGKVYNEIYACKLGDFKNWNCFMGLSTDSYALSVGSDGEFTGCIPYGGTVLFFKENCIHKLYGNQPSAYQLVTTQCRGVQRGSHRSLCVVNEVLYYKSRSDVCAYDGSLPTGISEALGHDVYYDAAAGTFGGKYYISMRTGDGAWHMFVYDTLRGIWHREDDTHAEGFTAWNDSLYYINGDSIIDANGVTNKDIPGMLEGPVSWSAESGLIGYELADEKYISRFNIRMRLGDGACCSLYIQYDSVGDWRHEGTVQGSAIRSFTLPVTPQRCDHFRLKLEGTGDVKIFSMAKLIENGSDAV